MALLEQFGNSIRKTDPLILDSLVEIASSPEAINPQMGVVKSIIATGDLKYIQNELVIQFVTMFNDNVEDFARLIEVWNGHLWPRENLYIRRVNRAYEHNEWLGVNLPQSESNSDFDSFLMTLFLRIPTC